MEANELLQQKTTGGSNKKTLRSRNAAVGGLILELLLSIPWQQPVITTEAAVTTPDQT